MTGFQNFGNFDSILSQFSVERRKVSFNVKIFKLRITISYFCLVYFCFCLLLLLLLLLLLHSFYIAHYLILKLLKAFYIKEKKKNN